MKCPKCKFDNPEGMKFCGECGAKLEIICPKCNFPNPPQFKFCGECGHNLKKPSETKPVDYSKPKSYTPKHLKDKILTTRSSIEGERKLVTVFFADVANYTSMSEKLDSEEVHQIMDGFFKILMDEIHKYEGTISQFTGDGIMAFFGAPVAHEDHAQRACYAALSIQKEIAQYGEKIEKGTGIKFRIRIGLNSGQVMVGTIGDDLRMDYSALGDTTNLAARMEQTANPGTVLLSANTYKLVQSYFEVNSLGKLDVKGKEEPQKVYELVKVGEVTTRIEASAAKGLTRFVGRKNSMAALMEVWEKAKAGSGQVVGIVGEAGVGKSRLLLEFRNRATQAGPVFLQGHCLHYGSNMSYLPVLDIVKAYFNITDKDREYIIRKKIKEGLDDNLADAVPAFQELLSLKADDEKFIKLEAKERREKTFEALRDLFIRLSEDRPLILAIEDLHWIDNTSQEFLDYLMGWIASKPVLLLLLYRPEYTHQWGSRSFYNRIGLDHLGTESSTDLIRAMLEGGDIAPELRDLILERAAGNPLFMEEFTCSLQENGTIQFKEDQYILSKSISELDVPHTVQGIIAARMDRLEDNLKRTMQVASVIGRDFAFRILQRICGMKDELKSYLLNLQGLEFIFEKSLFPELEYIFKHALTRDVAYNSLLQKRRKEIHEQIGLAIEELYSDRLEELYEVLAYHYFISDNHAKAIEYLKLCIQKADKNYANWEGFRYGQRAVNLLNQLPVSDQNIQDHIEVRLLTSRVANWLAFPENSLEILHEGEEFSRDTGNPALSLFLDRLSYFYGYNGEHEKSLEYAEQAYEEANRLGDIDRIAPTANGLCLSYMRTWMMKKIAEVVPKVIFTIEQTVPSYDSNPMVFNEYCTLGSYYGSALIVLGDIAKGHKYLVKSIKAAEETQDLKFMGISAHNYAQYLYLAVGDIDSAISYVRKATDYYEKANAPAIMLGLDWVLLSQLYTELGDFNTAKKCSEKGLSILNVSGMGAHRAPHLYALGTATFELGEEQRGLNVIEEAIKEAKITGEIGPEGMARMLWGRYYGRANTSEWKKAEESILKGIKIFEDLELRYAIAGGYLSAGGMLLLAGQNNRAKGYLIRAESSFREMTCDFRADFAKQLLDQIL